jgi:hypothetical protein
MELKDYLNSINYDKTPLMDNHPEIEKSYVPFVVNRCLSYFPDTIMYANSTNMRSGMNKKMQFDYLRMSIRPRKRFSKWMKNEISDEVKSIKEYFNYSTSKAIEIQPLLSQKEKNLILDGLNRGG